MATNTRRRNGEGTIYFDESRNRYRAEIQYRDSNGEKKKKKFSGKTKREVKEKLEAFSTTLLISQGKYFEADLYFEQYAEIWLSKQVNALKPTSFERKQGVLKNQVLPYLGHLTINSIRKSDIETMILGLIDSGLSYSSVKKAFEVARSCLAEYCNDEEVYMKNPCDGMAFSKYMKKPPSEVVYFTAEERKLIMEEAVRTYKNGAPVYRFGWAVVILMYSGLRLGELLALTWDDIDFDNKRITINKNAVNVKVSDENGEEHYRTIHQKGTKTDSGIRNIPLPDLAIDAFRELHKITGKETFVMTTKKGEVALKANIDRMFHRIINAVGLEEKLPKNHAVHALRHTFATMLFSNSTSSKVTSRLLGHSTTRITEDVYIHVLNDNENQAIEDLNKYCT